jgi:hypothetical protein
MLNADISAIAHPEISLKMDSPIQIYNSAIPGSNLMYEDILI